MSTQAEIAAVAQTQQIITQLLAAWASQNKAVTSFFSKYNDNFYLGEIAPDHNRAIYLFGHLVAVNDGLLSMFGLGEKLYPELEALFIANPDKAFETIPSIPQLREYWEKVNTTLTAHFAAMTPADWLSRHTRVSEEDFAKEPHRNKLNVLISRTSHSAYHMGQLVLMRKNEPAL